MGVGRIYLARDMEKWRDLVDAVLSFGSFKVRQISGLADELLASQEGLWSVKLFSY